jgi:CRISPR-associated endonuclease/helicase Cas3
MEMQGNGPTVANTNCGLSWKQEVSKMQTPYHWDLWAKTPKDKSTGDGYHPLIYHLLDVAAVAKVLWDRVVAPSTKESVARAFQVRCTEDAGAWVAYLAGLHDIGKASPAFAGGWSIARQALTEAGYHFPPIDRRNVPHGHITAAALEAILNQQGMERRTSRFLARIVGAHHGVFPLDGQVRTARLTRPAGGPEWERARAEVADLLRTTLGLGKETIPCTSLDGAPWLAVLLAGLTSVADWIGSDEARFPHCQPGRDLCQYIVEAQAKAEVVLQDLAWSTEQEPKGALDFGDLFPDYKPNQLQRAVMDLADGLQPPALVLIESPTGGGKTEAALYLADYWQHVHGAHGMFFGLPTQATSNQMFSRVSTFLSRRYPEGAVSIQLLHGHASLSAEFRAIRDQTRRLVKPSGVCGEDSYDEASPSLVAAEWFTYRKRGLLAPYGVGTVDQALLAVLQTRHFFVRLAGLAGKTVIVDEVHAYDTYMARILDQLLTWLACLGCSVLLLSATLPARRRSDLICAYAGGLRTLAGVSANQPDSHRVDTHRQPPVQYPRVSWCTARGSGVAHIGSAERQVSVKWVDGQSTGGRSEYTALGQQLRDALSEGGCAAVVCNTVGAAQSVYKTLKDFFNSDELDLFHARFPFAQREERETRTVLRFGKQPKAEGAVSSRPRRFVLVATQVIEQSLDLDFDLMVSQVAPVDLLLQRMGRLQRHELPRPPRLESPVLWLLSPAISPDEVPDFGFGDEHVYEPHLLLRTWLELATRETIEVPQDVEPLIESVYGDSSCPADSSESLRRTWSTTRVDLEKRRHDLSKKAGAHLVCKPDPDVTLLESTNNQLEEENPCIAPVLQAVTRLADPTIAVVLLGDPEMASLDPRTIPDEQQALKLLARSVNLSHRGVVGFLLNENNRKNPFLYPSGWRKSALLRHHRLLSLDDHGVGTVGGWEIVDDSDLGILVRRKGG